MGCSSERSIKIDSSNIRPEEILNELIDLYIYESKLIEHLKENKIPDSVLNEEFFLINKFWLEEYENFLGYEDIVKRYRELNEHLNDKNKQELYDIINKNSVNKYKDLRKLVLDTNRIKNNFIIINNGEEIFPDKNTYVIRKKNIDKLIKVIVNTSLIQELEKNLNKGNIVEESNRIIIIVKELKINNPFYQYKNKNYNNIKFICSLNEKNELVFLFSQKKIIENIKERKNNIENINNYSESKKDFKFSFKSDRSSITNYTNNNKKEEEKYDINNKDEKNLSLIKEEQKKESLIDSNNIINNDFNNYPSNNNQNDINLNQFQNMNYKKNVRYEINNNDYVSPVSSYNLIEDIKDKDNNNSNEPFNNGKISENKNINIDSNINNNIINENNNSFNNIFNNNNYDNYNIRNECNNNFNINGNNFNAIGGNKNILNSNMDNKIKNNENNNMNNIINNENSNIINNENSNIINNENSNIINDFPNRMNQMKRIRKLSFNSIINEFIQCLANIEQIKEFYIENEKEIIEKNKNYPIVSKRFINTLKFIFNKKYDNEKLINDEFFIKNYSGQNRITTSIIQFLFSKLNEELKDMYINNNNIIEKYFYGKEGIICECANCNYPVNKVQNFFYLQFNVYNVFDFCKKKNNNLKSISLIDCFNYNKYKYDDFICQKCGKNKCKKYSYYIMNLPEIIIVILENANNKNLIINSLFSSNSLIQENNKNNKKGYTLINRINKNENNEFTTYLRFYENLNWYECKENEIIESNKEKTEKGIPYILMYQKVDDLPNNKYVDELDRSIEIDNDEKLELIFYSTVSKIRERLDNLYYNMKIEEIYNQLCNKYNSKSKHLFFNNSRKLDPKKTLKENNLKNNDFVIIVEHNI